MGYTHYFRSKRTLTENEWAELMNAAVVIGQAAEKMQVEYGGMKRLVELRGPLGDQGTKPQIDLRSICFNGAGPDLDHETFCIKQEPFSDFCKTARKPYDIAVVAILAYGAAKYGFEVGSDGDVLDWGAGTSLACTATGEPIPNPLMVNHMAGN